MRYPQHSQYQHHPTHRYAKWTLLKSRRKEVKAPKTPSVGDAGPSRPQENVDNDGTRVEAVMTRPKAKVIRPPSRF